MADEPVPAFKEPGSATIDDFQRIDMLLIVGSPSGRRASIDTLVAQTVPAAAATMEYVSRFSRCPART